VANYTQRIKLLKTKLQRDGLDALLISKRENIIYLTGLDIESSSIIITSGRKDIIITDARFAEEASEKKGHFEIALTNGSRYKIINRLLKKRRIKKLGFESNWLVYNNFLHLVKELRRITLVPKKYLVEDLRMVKDTDEISLLKRSVSILNKAFSRAKKRIAPGMTGADMAIYLDNLMRRFGAGGPAFETIVAQNPQSSRPHAKATAAPFRRGSAILMDMGACYKRYNSDLTRLLFLGRIPTKFKYVYNIIKTAQKKAIEAIRPGTRISELDKMARNYITRKGFGRYFLHSLGHGVGLEIHESPSISRKNSERLKPGMVFTVEPGIYIKGWGGLRIEDMVLVTEDGYEVLTDAIPK